MPHDILIVGAGLAGACAAAALAGDRAVTVLEAAEPGAGASGAAAGLVNPFPGRRGAPTWRHAEALEALREGAARAGAGELFSQPGLLRPARDVGQAELFYGRAASHHDELEWLTADDIAERWPTVAAPHGGLRVRHGGAIDLPALVRALLREVDVRTGSRVMSAGEGREAAWAELESGERLEADVVLLAPGEGFRHFPQFDTLPLQHVKGQTIRVRLPAGAEPLPLLAGFGYVVPERDTLLAGSTYEHSFPHTDPTAEAAGKLLRQAARMVPAMAGARVIESRAGVRVTVPARVSPRRLPMIGPLPGYRRLWGFVGLGSKGLLTAPLIARHLPEWLVDAAEIPPELSTLRFR